MYKWGQHSVTT